MVGYHLDLAVINLENKGTAKQHIYYQSPC
jgi:hypothetical protein